VDTKTTHVHHLFILMSCLGQKCNKPPINPHSAVLTHRDIFLLYIYPN